MTILQNQNNFYLKNSEDDLLKKLEFNFKSFYLSQSLDSSPYKIKELKNNLNHFILISKHIGHLFLSKDKYSSEKKEINKVVSNLIANGNYKDINDFMKNGLVLNPLLLSSLLKKITVSDIDITLFNLQKTESLHGALAELLFTSSAFQIYCHSSLSFLSENFSQEYIPPKILDDFNKNNASYKNILLRNISYDKDIAMQSINMHNICLNPKFSMHLFFHVLQRLFRPDNFAYISMEYGVGSVLKTLFPYVEPHLSLEDKKFLLDIVHKNKDKNFKNGGLHLITEISDNLIKDITFKFNDLYFSGFKEKMLDKVKEIYSDNKINFNDLSILHIKENKFLTTHTVIIEDIKNIFQKISKEEKFLDVENINKINKLLNYTLPTVTDKYLQIDINFRENIKNIEGKNAHQLFEESLKNIKQSIQEVELILEQKKINDLSILNRKNRIL